MKHQQVIVDYTTMLKSSGTCLCLIFSGWVLLRLIQAIFWLPGYMKANQTKLYSQLESSKSANIAKSFSSDSEMFDETENQIMEAIEEESQKADEEEVKKDK